MHWTWTFTQVSAGCVTHKQIVMRLDDLVKLAGAFSILVESEGAHNSHAP